MAFDISFNGFDISRVLSWQDNDGLDISSNARGRRHAKISQGFGFRKPKFVTLACEADADSEAALEAYWEDLMAAVTAGVGNLTRKDNGRYLKAILSGIGGIDAAERLSGKLRAFTLEFECEPFWLGAAQSVSFLSQAPGANNTVTNNGKASAEPVIEVSGIVGVGETVTITNTTIGAGMTWTGDLASGQSIIFDHPNARVLKGNADAMAGLARPNFWELKPGAQNLRYDGNDNVNLTVQWVERWP